MSSRMDRYYEKHQDEMKRTNRNSKLYDDLYNGNNYENIESISLNVGKEINIDDVKAILEKREAYNNVKDYQIVKPKEPVVRKVRYYEEENTSHDINELLSKAREEKPIEDKKRSLEETQVVTLEELISKKAYAKKKKIDKEDMEDLLNTIYDTNLLSSEDGDGLLDSLKATGKTVMSPSIRQVLDDAKKASKDEEEMDNSFFTSSLGLKDEEIQKDIEVSEDIDESNSKTLKFLIGLGVVFVLIVLFILIKFVVL